MSGNKQNEREMDNRLVYEEKSNFKVIWRKLASLLLASFSFKFPMTFLGGVDVYWK